MEKYIYRLYEGSSNTFNVWLFVSKYGPLEDPPLPLSLFPMKINPNLI